MVPQTYMRGDDTLAAAERRGLEGDVGSSSMHDCGTASASSAHSGRSAPARTNFCANLAVRSGRAVTAVAQCVATCSHHYIFPSGPHRESW